MSCIVPVSLGTGSPTCALSVVQIINASSSTADLAFLLLAALSTQNTQQGPSGVCASANFFSNALREGEQALI